MLDSAGNIATTATVPITISLGANPGPGVLSGTLTVNAVAGIATFPVLTVDALGTGYTLAAASGSLTGATSAPFNVADPLIVTNTNDSGIGSLRHAINFANNNFGTDTISFNIPGTAPFVINVPTALPAIGFESVIIDGTSQPGYAGVPLVEVRGISSSPMNGFTLFADACTIQGLAINGFGTAPALGAAISVLGDNTSLINNYIGLEPDGTTARRNEIGIYVAQGASNTFVGPDTGQSANLRNIVSGNVYPIVLVGSDNYVEDNYIGTNAAGTSAVPNTYGVIIYANGITVRDNVVSGNGAFGIAILDSLTQNALVERNRIGLAATTLTPIPNGGSGVQIPYQGIRGVRLSQNQIFGNNDLGIRLGNFNPGSPAIPNDPQDPDTGANGLQNYPQLSMAFTVGGTTRIVGSLNSTPSSTFNLEFFSSPGCHASGNGEGETFIGSAEVTTDAGGIASFVSPQITLPVVVPDGRFITATATDAAGNTSEFSQCTVVGPRSQILGGVFSNGVPLPNVQVRLTNPQGPPFTATKVSNSNGNFSYSFLPAADYTLTVIHPNLTFTPLTRFYPNLTTNQTNQNFVAGSPATFTLRGRARTDASGSSVSGGKGSGECHAAGSRRWVPAARSEFQYHRSRRESQCDQ